MRDQRDFHRWIDGHAKQEVPAHNPGHLERSAMKATLSLAGSPSGLLPEPRRDARRAQVTAVWDIEPMLKVIDRLRHALDRAIEEKNEKAVAVLLTSIKELTASVHETQGDATKDATGTADKG